MRVANQLALEAEARGARPKLSVTIVAQNEERTIARVLEAVRPIAHEIVFLDSGSSDRTIEIASEFGVRFFHQEWLGYAAQKNKAIDLAEGDWILSLDADEILTPELVKEIGDVLSSVIPDSIAGYSIPRVLYIGEEPVKHGGFYPDAQLRLFRRNRGRFEPRAVHEAVRVDGEVVQLKHAMLHYSYKDKYDFQRAMEKYARLSAQHYLSKGKVGWRAHPLNAAVHPLWTFLYRQIIRKGFLGGKLCFELNLIYSDYVRKKIRYLRELANGKDTGSR
jgi:glycosyltransferase involved in cell wall biosynthesis